MKYENWSLGELDAKSTQMFNVGYLLAPVYVDFVKWALAQTDKPAYVLLRDGQPVYDVAKSMKDFPGFERAATWEVKYLTRSLLIDFAKYPEDLVLDYLKSEGLADNSRVLIDTGFLGTIQYNLYKSYDIGTESLFMFYEGGEEFGIKLDPHHTTIKGYKNIENYHIADLSPDNNSIFEALPKLSKGRFGVQMDYDTKKLSSVPYADASQFERQFYKHFARGAKSYATAVKKLRDMDANADMATKTLGDQEIKSAIMDALMETASVEPNGSFVDLYEKPKKDNQLNALLIKRKQEYGLE